MKPFHAWNTVLRVDEVRGFIYLTDRCCYTLFPPMKWGESPLSPFYQQIKLINMPASSPKTHTITNTEKRHTLRLIFKFGLARSILCSTLKCDPRVVLEKSCQIIPPL